ncbi:hypothetical protein L1887_19316 [Cichorium endivia]|nr:hypothetical protein L1887_19316 [Cichorium endivia]
MLILICGCLLYNMLSDEHVSMLKMVNKALDEHRSEALEKSLDKEQRGLKDMEKEESFWEEYSELEAEEYYSDDYVNADEGGENEEKWVNDGEGENEEK